MTVAFASPSKLTNWIKAHTIGKRKKIHCFGNLCYYYLLQDPDPNMKYWFGYNPDASAFFVSDSILNNLRGPILRMEYGRLFRNENKSHLSAVTRVATEQRDRSTGPMLATLRIFYQEYADKLTDLDTMSDELQDIVDTAKYLNNLNG